MELVELLVVTPQLSNLGAKELEPSPQLFDGLGLGEEILVHLDGSPFTEGSIGLETDLCGDLPEF